MANDLCLPLRPLTGFSPDPAQQVLQTLATKRLGTFPLSCVKPEFQLYNRAHKGAPLATYLIQPLPGADRTVMSKNTKSKIQAVKGLASVDMEEEKAVKTPKEPKQELPAFRLSAPAAILSPEGLLTTHLLEEHGYDRSKFGRLSREDFDTDVNWMRYKAVDMRARGEQLIANAAKIEKAAEAGAAFADPKKRAQVKRFQKLAEAFADLQKQLASEGIDVDSLLNT